MFYFHYKSSMTWHPSKCKCTMWQSYPDRHPRTVLYSTDQRHSWVEPKNQPQTKQYLYKRHKNDIGGKTPGPPHHPTHKNPGSQHTNSQPVVAQWWLDRALCGVLPSTGRCFRGAVGWLDGRDRNMEQGCVCGCTCVCVLFRQGPLMSSFIWPQRALYVDLSSFGPVQETFFPFSTISLPHVGDLHIAAW